MCSGESRRGGFAITSSTRTAATPPSSSLGLSAGDPEVYMANQAVTSTNECLCGSQTWPDPLGRISEPGSWRAQASRPAASQAHLHSPGSPSWALSLLPPPTHPQGHPFFELLEAATSHITSLPPGLHHLWALSLPPTSGHVLMGNLPSGVDGWLGDTALPSLWAPTFFFLQWLWSCFHGNRAWWTLFTLPIYIVRNKTLLPLPGKSHGRRSLVGCSPWGRKESDTTERIHFTL